MRRWLPILALALLAWPARGEEEPPDALAARTAVAVEKGVEYLLGAQKRDGSWMGESGETALALLALHRSGLRPGHRGFDRGFTWHSRGLGGLDKTYDTALAVILLTEIDARAHAKTIRRLALRLVLSQSDNGQWSYKAIPGRGKKRGDNSNTQFAMLALWMARGAGVSIPPHVWTRARDHFRATQNPDGGWGYSDRQRRDSYGSMTAAGLCCVTIATAATVLGDPGIDVVRADPLVAKARAWLGRELAVGENPKVSRDLGGRLRERKGQLIGKSFWRLYWLWSLERSGRLLDVERFGEHDWYREGAEALLAEQRDDGQWVGGVSPMIGTSFVLLFLTRGTKPVTTKPITGGTTTPR